MEVDFNFTLKDFRNASKEDKEALFDKKLEQIKQIIVGNNQPLYASVLKKVSFTYFTSQQLSRLGDVFKENGLFADYEAICDIMMLISGNKGALQNGIKALRTHHLWDKAHSKLKKFHNDEIYKEERFNHILEQLREIVLSYRVNAEVMIRLAMADLTEKQEEAIGAVFTENHFPLETIEFNVSRRIRRYDPNAEGAEEALYQDFEWVWEKIDPYLVKLSPAHHDQIRNTYLAKHFAPKVASGEPLEDWLSFKDHDNTPFAQKILKLQQILAYHKPLPDGFYEGVLQDIIEAEWDYFEALRSTFRAFEREEDVDFVLIARAFIAYDGEKDLDAAFRTLKEHPKVWDRIKPKLKDLSPKYHVSIAKVCEDFLKPLATRFQEILDDLKIESLQEFKQKYQFRADYESLNWDVLLQLIFAKSDCLSPDERNGFIDVYLDHLKSKRNKTIFEEVKLGLLEYLTGKTEVYPTEIDRLTDAEVKQVAELYARIDQTPKQGFPKEANEIFLEHQFRTYCQHARNPHYDSPKWTLFASLLVKLYNKEMEQKTFLSIVESCFIYLTKEEINAIKNEPVFSKYNYWDFDCCMVKVKCNQLKGVETEALLNEVKEDLNVLVEKYKTRYLVPAKWLDLFYHIRSLNLPLLDVFKCKRQRDYYGNWLEVESAWNGEIPSTFLNAIQQWMEKNQAVESIQKLFQDAKPPNTMENLIEWKGILRNALKTPEFQHGFHLYTAFGREKASREVEQLKELCNFSMTGIEGLPLLLQLKKHLISLGFEELARRNGEVAYIAEREWCGQMDLLDIPLDKQQEALKALPLKVKALYLDFQANFSFPLFSLDYKNEEKESKTVRIVQMAPPTGPGGIHPEFSVLSRNDCKDNDHASLFIILESGTKHEKKWVQQQMDLSRKGLFSAAFPLQKGKFNKPYPLFALFKAEIINEIINGYRLDPSWLGGNNAFKADLGRCIDEVRDIFFPAAEELTASQMQIFIQLFNIRFALYLISYTSSTTFGFLPAGTYNPLLTKFLSILLDTREESAFMEKALINLAEGEMIEALAFLDDPGVQKRLRDSKVFDIQKMSYSF